MTNYELADVFDAIADLLEIKGEVVFKTLAYRRAALSLRELSEEAETFWKENRLAEIPGVGKAIAEKMDELFRTGKLEYLERLQQEVPLSLRELLLVPDLGPKRVSMFWKVAGITDLKQLKQAALDGRLAELPGMGKKSVDRILNGLEIVANRSERMTLGTAWERAEFFLEGLRKISGVEQAEAAGSLRRYKTTIGDIDLVIAADDAKPAMDWLTSHPQVQQVNGRGEAKSSEVLKSGTQLQLWAQPPHKFGTLLQFVTGSKEHNVHLRELAQKSGISLNEQALTDKDGKESYFSNEEDLYQALGMAYIPPEMREDRGEIDLALKNQLPNLLELRAVKADLHMHSNWSDGSASIEEMARNALALGYGLIAITDHSQSLGVANGLTPERLREQRIEINKVEAILDHRIVILQGCEVEIKADGSLDYDDDVLQELDLVIGSLHSSLRQDRDTITQRLLTALRHPHLDIVGHPSGRLLPDRPGADLDWDVILQEARKNNKILEIDANPSRLDLDEKYARKASEMGILMSIDSDAHSPQQLSLMKYGVSVARRAWVKPELILNTWSVDEIKNWLSQRSRNV